MTFLTILPNAPCNMLTCALQLCNPPSVTTCLPACLPDHLPACPRLPCRPAAVLSELGNFYKANGQRSRLSEDVAGRILERLGRAEGDLSAPDKEKVLGLF